MRQARPEAALTVRNTNDSDSFIIDADYTNWPAATPESSECRRIRGWSTESSSIIWLSDPDRLSLAHAKISLSCVKRITCRVSLTPLRVLTNCLVLWESLCNVISSSTSGQTSDGLVRYSARASRNRKYTCSAVPRDRSAASLHLPAGSHT